MLAVSVMLNDGNYSPEGLCSAEQTTPYAPSPTTSWMSYCSLTLKEILREPL
jgi:hypothetical protein